MQASGGYQDHAARAGAFGSHRHLAFKRNLSVTSIEIKSTSTQCAAGSSELDEHAKEPTWLYLSYIQPAVVKRPHEEADTFLVSHGRPIMSLKWKLCIFPNDFLRDRLKASI